MSKETAKHIFLYGIIGGILIAALKWSEYRFLVIDHSIEIYSALIAVIDHLNPSFFELRTENI